MYRKIIEKIAFKPITEEQFEQLVIPLKKMNVVIMRGDEETENRLIRLGAQGSTVGKDAVFFRQNVSISAVLEEIYHIKQNRSGLNDDKPFGLRTILNEIDAKKHLLEVANKYNIPRAETEETKKHLAFYEDELKKYYNKE